MDKRSANEADGSITLEGTVEDIVYVNPKNNYTVLYVSDKEGNLFTAVGILPYISEGEIVELVGEWSHHPDYGKQFSVSAYEKKLPSDANEILRYLSGRAIKGVGPVTAVKIVNKYGADSFDVIENHPEWLADIPGISMRKAQEISNSFKEQTALRSVMMFFSGYLGNSEVTRIYKRWGGGAVGIIRDDPYLLSRESGIGFEKADEIAKSLGIPQDSQVRISGALIYILNYNAAANGHTCMPDDKLTDAAAAMLGLGNEKVRDALEQCIDSGKLRAFSCDGRSYIQTQELFEAEEYISDKLVLLNSRAIPLSDRDISAIINYVEEKNGMIYAEMQKKAIYEAMTGGVTVLTGGPGTGKTTVIKALIEIFRKLGMRVVLAAPTGRAAKRMSESTSEEAKTVHRMLEMERTDNDLPKFNRNAKNPLDENVIIIDEASMLDVPLTEGLISAVKSGSRLILIGDADQLPPVGSGNVLGDIIKSGAVNTICLTEIFRQSKESLIVTNAHRINSGENPVLSSTTGDFFFVNRPSESTIPDALVSLVTDRLPTAYGEEIREQIQVITPSRKGRCGTENLNILLQEKLNPYDSSKKQIKYRQTIFRCGDRVMQIKNDYDIVWEKYGIEGSGIFNGDIGIIEDIDIEGEALIIRFDDREVKYPFELLDELELSYAITVHKSQGSEYPFVVMPLSSCAPMLMTRNLFYTAVTRARKMVVLVGRMDIAAKMVENNVEVLSYTTLESRLRRADN